MQCQEKRFYRSWRWVSFVTLASLVLSIPNASAKGPPLKPDFVTTTNDEGYWEPWSFETSGALTNAGEVSVVETWSDNAGMEWARYRFETDASNYFETVLPTEPVKGVNYDVVLTAGPNGFWAYQGNNLVLYQGEWAYGIASASIRRKSFLWWGWSETWVKYYYDSIEWRLEGFFVP